MPTDVVLDSTAIAAIFFRDTHSEQVEATLKRFERFHTLDLAFAEVGNVAWKRINFFKEDFATHLRALLAATDFIRNVCNVIETREVLAQALEVGVKEGITIYDSLFVALAKRMKVKLLTTDEKLHDRVRKSRELNDLAFLP